MYACIYKSRDSSAGIETGYGLDDRMIGGSNPDRGWKFFSTPPHPDQIWGPPSLLSNSYQDVSLRVKRPGCEADHSLPSSAEVKE
jgi:hypothetical protein